MSERIKELEDELEEALEERDQIELRIEGLQADLRRARAETD